VRSLLRLWFSFTVPVGRRAYVTSGLSPYGVIDAPHLDGHFRATHGEFRLEELPGRRTRLVGTTRYTVDMFPQAYLRWFADRIVEAIHQRVLGHVRRARREGVSSLCLVFFPRF